MFDGWFKDYGRFFQTFCNAPEDFPFCDAEEYRFRTRQLLSAADTAISAMQELCRYENHPAFGDMERLCAGMNNFISDMQNSANMLNIPLTPSDAFTPGVDTANTPGEVVFSCDLFELLQYHATTVQVHATPVLFVPSVINKYYILDLTPEKSMVRWLLGNGYTVFMVSWKNPHPGSPHWTLSEYVLDGVTNAITAVTKISKRKTIHAAGYCLGGTLLALAIARYQAKGRTSRVKSASFFTTLLDFTHPGELGFFTKVSPRLLAHGESQDEIMDGRDLNVIFNLLREKTLYWDYYLRRYIRGEDPGVSDFLFWSGDSMNMSLRLCEDIVREFYTHNRFISEAGIRIGDVHVDISQITVPCYFVSTQSDHIAPWKSCFAGVTKINGDSYFVLGKSGHVAGIINPPEQNKYGFWHGRPLESRSGEEWKQHATYHTGSWWGNWEQWLQSHDKGKRRISPPDVHPPVAPGKAAPGSYVLEKCSATGINGLFRGL